jgi:hypothetical protein
MAPATVRVVRSAAVGASGAALAAAAHVTAGGQTPALVAVTLSAVALAAGAYAAAGGALGVARLLALLLAAQALLHAAFELTAPAGTGHAHHGGDAGALTPAGEGAMIAAHVAATLVLALLLARGEAWLLGAGRLAVGLVRRLARADRPAPVGLAVRVIRLALPLVRSQPSLRPLAGAASRRGPPRVALRLP